MPPDPKPSPRVVSFAAGRTKARLEGRCRVCGSTFGLSRHHLVPRSLGGDDVDENLMPLCEGCHGAFERSRERRLAGALIRAAMRADELAYVVDKKGTGFLERYYPLRP